MPRLRMRLNGTRWWRSCPAERPGVESLYVGARSAGTALCALTPWRLLSHDIATAFATMMPGLITLVFYLNSDWAPVLVASWCFMTRRWRSGARRVPPRAGTMVCFRSELFRTRCCWQRGAPVAPAGCDAMNGMTL